MGQQSLLQWLLTESFLYCETGGNMDKGSVSVTLLLVGLRNQCV